MEALIKMEVLMKKTISLLALSLILVVALCSCNNSKNSSPKPDSSHKSAEIEKELAGKWKFLYTDAVKQIPPRDLVYIIKADHTSQIQFTDDKNEKRTIDATYQVTEDRIKFSRKGVENREFQVQFQGRDTVQFTEINSKSSITLGRVAE